MPEFDSTIEYRPVAGFPAYMIGNDGSVWACWKQVSKGYHKGCKKIIGDKWYQLTLSPSRNGYLRIMLCPGRKLFLVHHLVLEAFVGSRPPDKECRHFPDNNRANNHISNLSWGTAVENATDKLIHGTDSCGSKSHFAKLTDDDVRQIRLLGKFLSQPRIAKRFGVSQVCVSQILLRKTWKHVKSAEPISQPSQ